MLYKVFFLFLALAAILGGGRGGHMPPVGVEVEGSDFTRGTCLNDFSDPVVQDIRTQ